MTKDPIAPRRQERKENSSFFELGAPFDSAQDMLCTFARDTVFPISFSSIFKYLWLGFDLMDMILK
jgi:hypothetical protein